MITRNLESEIREVLSTNKAVVILGARQVGKTTLLQRVFGGRGDVVWMNGDNINDQAIFEDISPQTFAPYVENHSFLVIDEAQRIENIGLKLKIIHDNFKDKIQIIATGSSSFDLANSINEPLTGRKWTYKMFPLSFSEMAAHHGLLEEQRNLENRMLYGYYPDVVTNAERSARILGEIANDNLYKDIFKWENIKKPVLFSKLVKALAYQAGSILNCSELANLTGLDSKTVLRYITLLEQSYVVFRLGSFSSNLRNELKKSEKIYFYDNGIRNAVIGDFRPLAGREDVGHLFENLVISELAKKYMNESVGEFAYFWRTKQQQEIDVVMQRDGRITAYEIKYSPTAKSRIPATFIEKYSPATVATINRGNLPGVLMERDDSSDYDTLIKSIDEMKNGKFRKIDLKDLELMGE